MSSNASRTKFRFCCFLPVFSDCMSRLMKRSTIEIWDFWNCLLAWRPAVCATGVTEIYRSVEGSS